MISVINLPKMLTDSEEAYIQRLEIISEHADTLSTLKISRNLAGNLAITIIPSLPVYKEQVLRNVLGIHRTLSLTTDFSKSSKLSPNITFTVAF